MESTGENASTFIQTMNDLVPFTTYYVRAYAFNSEGISYGNEIWFTTNPLSPPSLVTFKVSLITSTTAECGGSILYDGGSTVIEKGVCWSISSNPTIVGPHTSDGARIGSFISSLSSLTPNTEYYVRAYATNGAGTGYGNEVPFTLWVGNPGPPITDKDGNNYKTVVIGTQLWMAENLKTTTLNDGTAIPNVNDLPTWDGLITAGYCWYDNNIENKTPYGALYNWYAVSTGKLCPNDWHVPSKGEWNILADYLGGGYYAGVKLKETGTYHWKEPNNGTNVSGFTALPAGCRGSGYDGGLNMGAYFWLTTMDELFKYGIIWTPNLSCSSDSFYIDRTSFKVGKSVRCLKDS
jgi:uncharacterized protein (TIGR02145 family)